MRVISWAVLFLFLCACSEEEEQEREIDWRKEDSIEMNKVFAEEEHKRIENYLERRPDWKMTATESGLRYMIYQTVDTGDLAIAGQIAHVAFTVSLLDGTECYASEPGSSEHFLIERDDIESGIHEGVKYMKPGEKAKFILPAHLAHGLIGDLNEIPMLSTLIYDIHLIKLTNP